VQDKERKTVAPKALPVLGTHLSLAVPLALQLINLFMAVIIEAYERHAEMVDWDLAPHVGASCVHCDHCSSLWQGCCCCNKSLLSTAQHSHPEQAVVPPSHAPDLHLGCLQMLDEFVWSWVEYDFEGKGTIEPRYFGHVLRDTAPPLGLGPDASDVSGPHTSAQWKSFSSLSSHAASCCLYVLHCLISQPQLHLS
jgi:hypothetical protein